MVIELIHQTGSKNREQELAVAMPNKQLLIANLTEGKRSPIFEVRQLKCGSGWYVRILWPYGQEQHVSGFTSADAARCWIDRKSVGWLQSRAAALRVVQTASSLVRFSGEIPSPLPTIRTNLTKPVRELI